MQNKLWKLLFLKIFIVIVMVFWTIVVKAQVPVIKPAAYVVRIETNIPYTLDPNTSATIYGVRQHVVFEKSPGNTMFDLFSNNTGGTAYQYFFNADEKPGFIYVSAELDSMVLGWNKDIDCGINSLVLPDLCQFGYYLIYNGWRSLMGNNCSLQYPIMDTTFYGYENCAFRVRVNPASDDNLNLPSHDLISINVTNPDPDFNWEYEVLDPSGAGTWMPLPNSVTKYPGFIQLDGQTLFGNNWISQVNKTVLFRLRKMVQNQSVTSNILVYTHRLSAPKIWNVSTIANPCFGMDSAAVKIDLSRQLYPGETLNIFLKDSATGADFSALNITGSNLTSQNKYVWQKELIQGNYRMSLIGKYNGMATYTGSIDHFSKVIINDPPQLKLQSKQNPVLCFSSNTGSILMRFKGGVGNYKYQITDTFNVGINWQSMPSANLKGDGYYEYTHTGLEANFYKVKLRDGNGCMLLDSLGNEQFLLQPVHQPAQPLQMPLLETSPVTVTNATNGSITIQLAGGTPFPAPEIPQAYKRYEFEWRDSTTNNLITNFTLDTVGKYETSIKNLPAGTYRFIAWDRNYDPTATANQQGCRIDIYIKLRNPDPLAVNIMASKKISCNGGADGILWAKATGGIPLTDNLRYNFTWFKVVNGVNTNLNVNDSLLSNQPPGQYYVEIRDKYNNLKGSSLFTLTAPLAIAATTATTPSSCYFTADGSMQASVTGGTPPYKYEWSNGSLLQQVTGVAGGTYYVVIRDSSLCELTKQVVVTSPNVITTTAAITKVTCNNTSTGKIALTAKGGTGTLTYLWSTGGKASSISNVPAGKYWYRITDAKGCYDSDTITLDVPDFYAVNAGADRKICTNQMVDLTPVITSAAQPLTVKWSTPAGIKDSSTIRTATPGTYIVQVLNGRGCTKTDTVILTSIAATVNTNFTVSTQAFAGENTTLVNISPQMQDSVKWQLPTNMSYQLITQSKNYCELKIADTGKFTVGMKAYYANGCIDELYKQVNVVRSMSPNSPGNQADAFLKQMSIAPNPTSGSFTLNLLFNAVTQARVRIVNVLTNISIDTRLLNGAASYSEPYNIGGQPQGIYIVLIETMKGNFIYKLNKL